MKAACRNTLRDASDTPHLDVGGVDVACVVLLGRDELHPVLLIGDDFSDPATLSIFWQSGGAEDAIGLFVWDLLILCEHHSLFQLLLQGSELQKKRGVSSPSSNRATGFSALPLGYCPHALAPTPLVSALTTISLLTQP